MSLPDALALVPPKPDAARAAADAPRAAADAPADADAVPRLLELNLCVMREKAARITHMQLVQTSLADAHLPHLLRALHHSESAVTHLDLRFNRLSGDGLRSLCAALAREGMMAHDLTRISVGGNPISAEAGEAARELLRVKRPDVTLDFAPRLAEGKRLMDVGKVFPDSPAAHAGLVRGDCILAFGPLSVNGKKPNRAFKSEEERELDALTFFEGVAESVKPLVAAAVRADRSNAGAIDVIVERPGTGDLQLTLRPQQWSGTGLLGAKITAIEQPKPPKKPDSGPRIATAPARF